jgi:hypothetical protein
MLALLHCSRSIAALNSSKHSAGWQDFERFEKPKSPSPES